jgi:diacylglycerol kinase family enzyme
MFCLVSTTGHKYAFLVNPVSGSGKGRRIRDVLPRQLAALGLSPADWTLEDTVRDALSDQVERLFETHDRVVVAGGDGTVGQALDGALRCSRPDRAIGFLPLGTGNDMAHELKILGPFRRRGSDGLVRSFLQDRTVEIDLWSVDGKAVMANYLSIGLDAAVAARFAEHRSRNPNHSVTRNKLFYFQAGFAHIRTRLKDFELHLDSPDSPPIDLGGVRSVLVLNISSFAGGTLRSPGTRPDDGELTIVPIPSFLTYMGLVPGGLFAPLARGIARLILPDRRATSVHARWEGENPLQIDGEPRPDLGRLGSLDISHKGRIRVLLGPKTPWFARRRG